MQPKRKNEQLAQEGRFKNRIILILLAMLGVALWKFSTYPQQLTVYTAPDVSKAFVQSPGDIPPNSVYGFARTLWESINYCTKDCQAEYPKSLDRYRAFLTKACYDDLNRRFERQSDLYNARSRRLLPTENAVFDLNKVRKMGVDLWYVVLEYVLDDDIGGITTRHQTMQYPLKITANSAPTQYNPWGLAIDCYWEEPKVVEFHQLEQIR